MSVVGQKQISAPRTSDVPTDCVRFVYCLNRSLPAAGASSGFKFQYQALQFAKPAGAQAVVEAKMCGAWQDAAKSLKRKRRRLLKMTKGDVAHG
jgi:hypothetical protein